MTEETVQSALGSKPNYSRSADEQGIWTPYQDGLMTPGFFDVVVPVIIGTILSLKDLGRAAGESGRLTK
jgi:linoleate 10R-lipoxygenase